MTEQNKRVVLEMVESKTPEQNCKGCYFNILITTECEHCLLETDLTSCPFDCKYGYYWQQVEEKEDFCEWIHLDKFNGKPLYKATCHGYRETSKGKFCLWCGKKIKEVRGEGSDNHRKSR